MRRILAFFFLFIVCSSLARGQAASGLPSPTNATYIANASSTGTTVNTLTKLTGAPSTAVITATTDTGGAIGITISGAGTTGTATIQTSGLVNCVFSNATTAGDYVQISSATAGNCADTGAATYPTSGQVVGRVLSTNGSAGTYQIDLFPSEIKAASAGGGGTVTTTGSPANGQLAKFSGATSITTATAHDVANALLCADTSGSGTVQVCNTSPTYTPAAGDWIIYTTTTANTGTGLTLNVNSLGAKSVAKWQNTTTLAANDVLANKYVLATYDGTNWELSTIGNAPSGGTVAFAQLAQTVISGSATVSFTWSSISGSYTNLKIKCSGRSATASTGDDILIQFNGDTTSGDYFWGYLLGSGTPSSQLLSSSTSIHAMNLFAASANANWFNEFTIDINNYTQTAGTRTLTSVGIHSSQAQITYIGLWTNVANAITSIKVFTASGSNFVAGTTCTLYGEL